MRLMLLSRLFGVSETYPLQQIHSNNFIYLLTKCLFINVVGFTYFS